MRLRSFLLLLSALLAADEALARGGQNIDLLLRIFNQAAKSADAPPGTPGAPGSQALVQPDVVPVTVTDTRFGLYGFTVTPPQASGWLVRKPQGTGLVLARPVDGQKAEDYRTFAVSIVAAKIESTPQTLAEFVTLRQAREVFKGARFKLLKHEESAEA